MGMSQFCYTLDYFRWNQRLCRAFITDEIFITDGSGLQKNILRLKGLVTFISKQ